MRNEKAASKAGNIKHVFEHLGQAPYRFVGYSQETYQACPGAPIQPGTSCDHCGTGISDVFRFVSADGRGFKVGSMCVDKAGDRGLKKQIGSTVNEVRRKRQAERDRVRIGAAKAWFDGNRAAFEAEAHPRGFKDRETGQALTLADYIEWMFANAGTTGKVATAKMIERRTR
ncbi:MAG: hypothetical protein ACREIS_05585 [Nitrospiraceae bacterium]